ncbi:MAG TPA: SOS response-associated peptidase [Chloroflexota bacterium]|nr:SOS response-associated peptidase [Chloroflexota bacterium]HUM70310.1 SOS response-associated peptidase [Chloroflexota bacterium]
MCGRFALISSTEEVADALGVDHATIADIPPAVPRYNIAPTQPVLAAYLDGDGRRRLTFYQWGLIPSWSKDVTIGSRLINARSETVTEKPSFRNAFKRRRCLIPADGFYEWQKLNGGKQPIYIHGTDGRPLALAGLWEVWQEPEGTRLQTCTILTTTPNELMASIHDRMPVILEPEDFSMWLEPGAHPDEALHLLRPYPAAKMKAYPVSTAVNNPRNDTAACIQPLT